jgi:hypothetical protein
MKVKEKFLRARPRSSRLGKMSHKRKEQHEKKMRHQVLMATHVQIFWVIALCCVVKAHLHFRDAFCLHHHTTWRNIPGGSHQHEKKLRRNCGKTDK